MKNYFFALLAALSFSCAAAQEAPPPSVFQQLQNLVADFLPPEKTVAEANVLIKKIADKENRVLASNRAGWACQSTDSPASNVWSGQTTDKNNVFVTITKQKDGSFSVAEGGRCCLLGRNFDLAKSNDLGVCK
jgi:hypothetical protein